MRRVTCMVLGSALLAVALLSPGSPANAQITNGGAKFVVTCKLSHLLKDDPIMHPGMPGMSHLHNFFGSSATNADSTVTQLQHAPTTCDRSTDTAAYWAPAVYHNGALVKDLAMTAYYRNTARIQSAVRTIPTGLKMMAGNAMATKPQPLTVAEWSCRQPSGAKESWFSSPPMCTTGRLLVMKIWFPDCWDGKHLDSPNHTSQLAYSQPLGVCPASHPVNIPQLAITIPLDVPTVSRAPAKNGTAGYLDHSITLASGSVYTLHADFWNTWNPTALADLVHRCLVLGQSCPSK